MIERLNESETIELKKSTSELKEAITSIVSILNKHHKGQLYFGVKNNGTIVGQDVTENTLREVSKAISDHIEPKIYPKISKIEQAGKDCVLVDFEGLEKPYFAYGRAYVRVSDENKQLSAKELENFILRKNASKWDSKLSDSLIDDADEKILREFVQKANIAGRIKFIYTNKKEVLEKLNLLKDSKLTNGARLLFSIREPIEVQAAVFAGTDKTTFLDIKQFKGNIFELLKISEEYIKAHINWKAELVERTRQEIPEIPIRAITEALVNSLCHRDYQAPESNKIAVYKDRIEIWNPGEFPEGLKPQDFIKKDIPSILRNPQIANNLYLSADIEKWGSGLKRISEECKKNNVNVKFEVLKYGFTVQFTRPKVGTVIDTLKPIEKEILKEITQNKQITIDEITQKVRKGRRTIVRYISELKKKKILNRIGPDKTGHWEVNQ